MSDPLTPEDWQSPVSYSQLGSTAGGGQSPEKPKRSFLGYSDALHYLEILGISGPQCHPLMPEAVDVILFPTLCITKELNKVRQTQRACVWDHVQMTMCKFRELKISLAPFKPDI